jgi:uncharacterized membrane protein YgcG
VIRIWATIGLLLAAQAPAFGLGTLAPALAQGPLPSATSPVLTPSFRDAVYGDFLQVGNSVLRCPVAGEETGGPAASDCAAATANQTPGGLLDNRSNNNGYFMHQAEGPLNSGMFNASSAELELPQGATVRYAQLNWGGHTGKFVGFSGVNCQRPILLQGSPPPTPAKATPDQQDVKLGIGTGKAEAVPRDPNHYALTSGLVEPSEVYTDWADVTARFANAPSGKFQVSVGDVWAPSGPGCAGGWSLIVVFGYDEPHDPFNALRVVDVYTGGLPNGGALLPGIVEPLVPGFPSIIDGLLPGLVPSLTGSSVILPGVNPRRSGAGVVIGLTAYDGDWHQGGETLKIDGTAVKDPCRNDTEEDFFRSCANGAVDPLDPAKRPQNNLSVESKTIMPQLADNDTGQIELRLDSVADFLVLQTVVLAENVDAAISITNTGPTDSVGQGDAAIFTIEVTNSGALPLFDIKLEDTSEPAPPDGVHCLPPVIQPLDPGESATVVCMQAAGDTDITNTAKVTASFLTGGDNAAPRTVNASASAIAHVTPAKDYAVQRVPDKLVTHAGEAVTFAVTLINNTDANTLTDLVYTDAEDADCDGPEADAELGPKSTIKFSCVVRSPQSTFTSHGMLTAKAGGDEVTVTSQDITVRVIDPALTITQAVDKDTIYRGDKITLTFTVSNTATDDEETLSHIAVSVPKLPDCHPQVIDELAAGQSTEVTCESKPGKTVDAVAQAEAVDQTGETITSETDSLKITVLNPLISVQQKADHPTIRVGGEVAFTFTVKNISEDDTVTGVQVKNATIPDCEPEAIPQLAPDESATRTCKAKPDRTFDSQTSATALDPQNLPMEAAADPLRITVINPVMTITTTVTPDKAKHGAPVQFQVTVRNIGDVPLNFEVNNDKADDCNFKVDSPDGLAAGAAQGRQCTTKAPTSESETEFTNTAGFTASPIEEVNDDGEPIEGDASATVELQAGQAPPEPTPSPPTGGSNTGTGSNLGGGSSSGSSGGGGGSSSSGGGQGQGLAVTGASLLVPMLLAGTLIGAGLLLTLAGRRPDEHEDSFLARWWLTN